ncbi:MAG TPA: hypothetical protein VNG33_23905, partial [Polyangiaceae bacterium]|nr:hypothetical protein [Polyangiaceae bacterium]
MPRGLVRVRDHAGARVIPVETADVPDPELMLAVRRLADEVLNPVLRFEPLSPARRAALLEAYDACFDGLPRGAWASVLTQEIQAARRAILGAQEAAASRDEPLPVTSTASFTKTTDGYGAYPGLPAKFAINVRRQLLWTDGMRATMALVGELDGETRILSTEVGTFGDVPGPPQNATPQT